jgi:hypothetical protein
MPLPTRTLEQLQEWVWSELPIRKNLAGKEAVFDAVSAAIHEWPDEALSAARAGGDDEMASMLQLSHSVKRHMALVYGDKKFGSVWIVALQILLPIIVDLILKWWRRRKEHRARLRMWRRKWVNGNS